MMQPPAPGPRVPEKERRRLKEEWEEDVRGRLQNDYRAKCKEAAGLREEFVELQCVAEASVAELREELVESQQVAEGSSAELREESIESQRVGHAAQDLLAVSHMAEA